jgi:hypothetical protein
VSLINVSGSTLDMYHVVYDGASGCGELGDALICSDGDTSNLTGLVIGNTYYVQVYTYTATPGQTSMFDICVGTPPPPPANDECNSSVMLTVETEINDLVDATQISGTIASGSDSGVVACAGTANDDVWYSFVATTEEINIDVTDDFDGVIELFSGDCGALVSVECDDYDATYGNPRISRNDFIVGETYYVRVFGYYSSIPAQTEFTIAVWSQNALSINDFELSSFNYYPNPVNDKLSLRAQNTIQNVSVYNMLGQEVIRTSPNMSSDELDMSNLESGAYFVQVTIQGVTETIRVIKK